MSQQGYFFVQRICRLSHRGLPCRPLLLYCLAFRFLLVTLNSLTHSVCKGILFFANGAFSNKNDIRGLYLVLTVRPEIIDVSEYRWWLTTFLLRFTTCCTQLLNWNNYFCHFNSIISFDMLHYFSCNFDLHVWPHWCQIQIQI